MQQIERRSLARPLGNALKSGLNLSQLASLYGVERFGWDLKFVRHTPFQPSVPVVFDAERKAFAVLETDGTINEHPAFDIRK